MIAFEYLLSILPKSFDVLDVGSGGLGGENTTNFLLKYFQKVTGICINKEPAEKYKIDHPEIDMIIGDYYKHIFDKKFDLIVQDEDVLLNLKDWESNQEYARTLLKPGGYLLTYIITTDQYGNPEVHPKAIRDHWVKYWGVWPVDREYIGNKLNGLEKWEAVLDRQEERRPYIHWILLKLK